MQYDEANTQFPGSMFDFCDNVLLSHETMANPQTFCKKATIE